MDKKVTKRAKSKDNLRSYSWTDSKGQVTPDFNFQTCLTMVNDDPVARGALIHFVDKGMENGYAILNRKSRVIDDTFARKLEEDYIFRTNVVRKLFLLGKLYNNVFLEIVKKSDSSAKELNILDSNNIKPFVKSNGDAEYYESKIPNPKSGIIPRWEADEIVWFKFGDRSSGYAGTDLKALYENLLIKEWVKRYVGWLWKTGQYRLIYNFTNASDKSVSDFIAYNAKHDGNFQKPFLTKGEMTNSILRDMKEQESIVEFFRYLDNQTLILLRVPPIDAGIPDASGRSNADAQNNSMAAHIESFKTVIEDNINYVLFPRLNKSNSFFKFKYNDRFEEKQLIENMNLMKNMGMKEEAIREYLTNRGMVFRAKKLFEPLPKPMEGVGGIPGINKDKNTMPSRVTSTGSPQTNIGTGKESSTRQEQITKRSFNPDPNWVIN